MSENSFYQLLPFPFNQAMPVMQ